MGDPSILSVGMLYCQTGSSNCIERPLSAILDAVSQGPGLDMLLAPEWFFVAPDKYFYSPQEFAFIRRRLEQATKGLEMLLIPGSIARLDEEGHYRNTALAISNGKTLLEYSKQRDGGDGWFAQKKGLSWRGGEEEGIFRWRDYAAGIEICADHGTLKNEDNQTGLDFQIVVSCGTTLCSYGLNICEGGIALLCDGCGVPYHDIQQAVGPKNVQLTKQNYVTLPLRKNMELRTYLVPAPGRVVPPVSLSR